MLHVIKPWWWLVISAIVGCTASDAPPAPESTPVPEPKAVEKPGEWFWGKYVHEDDIGIILEIDATSISLEVNGKVQLRNHPYEIVQRGVKNIRIMTRKEVDADSLKEQRAALKQQLARQNPRFKQMADRFVENALAKAVNTLVMVLDPVSDEIVHVETTKYSESHSKEGKITKAAGEPADALTGNFYRQ